MRFGLRCNCLLSSPQGCFSLMSRSNSAKSLVIRKILCGLNAYMSPFHRAIEGILQSIASSRVSNLDDEKPTIGLSASGEPQVCRPCLHIQDSKASMHIPTQEFPEAYALKSRMQ